MTRENAIDTIRKYFEENEAEFNETIQELDGYNGILGDDRYYPMEYLDELYAETAPSELLARVFYGHDADTSDTQNGRYSEFNPNREYFTYNGYGNLVSSDYVDYSAHLDDYFVSDLIDHADDIYCIPDEVKEIIDNIEE